MMREQMRQQLAGITLAEWLWLGLVLLAGALTLWLEARGMVNMVTFGLFVFFTLGAGIFIGLSLAGRGRDV